MGFAARDQRDDDSDGFTIIELVVALGLGMFMFSALASMLLGATKIVSIQKSRTQANDLATIGIEDLQRLNYDAMGLCTAPPGPTPSDMTDTVLLPNCSSPTKYGPCAAGAAPAGAVPDESYTCTLRNIAYEIRRFVAYGDISHSVKRLAVVVEWDDRGGRHQVSQQSSLRIPSRAALIGAAPPSFNAAGTTVSGPVTLNAGGRNSSSISLNAQVSGLAAGASSTTGDSVIAVFQTVGPGGREQESVELTSANGTNWTGSVPADYLQMGPGTQFVVFSATRKTDGKVNSVVKDPALVVSGSVPYPPSANITTQPPSTIDIDASGAISSTGPQASGFSLALQTTNVAPGDRVAVTFNTLTGAFSVAMTPDAYTGGGCTAAQCQTTWRTTIRPADGYLFPAGTGKFFFTVAQLPAGSGFEVDAGATASAASSTVTFS